MDLSTQTVLVIGGVHEVSAGVARAFHEAGARLILAYEPPPPGADEPSAAGGLPGEVHRVEVPLRDPAALTAALSALTFQTAVISPGWFVHAPFMAATPEAIDAAFAHNLEYATYAAQAAARRLMAQGRGGGILFLTSVAGMMPMVHTNLTGSSLAAVEVIAKMAAVDLAPHGIRVNLVAAGWVEGAWSRPLLTPEGAMHIATDIPAGHVGTPEAVGEACCFLASPQARYITGAVLPVDGGFLLTKSAGKTPYPQQQGPSDGDL